MAAAPSPLMAKRTDVSVKMDEQVVKRAKIAAAFREMTLAEYLSEVVRIAAEEDIAAGYPDAPIKGESTKKGRSQK